MLRKYMLLVACCVAFAGHASAAEVSGFLEPLHSIDVAASETGLLTQIAVQEGASVSKGQLVARLDQSVLQAALALAQQSAASQGAIRSAEAEINVRSLHLNRLAGLAQKGHAPKFEVERAKADLAIAQARLLTVKEELLLRRLESEKIIAQIRLRDIRAPFAGVVSHIYKDPGEYVAGNSPVIMKIDQLTTLLAVFSIPESAASSFKVGRPTAVIVFPSQRKVSGSVHFVGATTDAGSSTVKVKIKLNNPGGSLRSGARCVVQIPATR